MSTRLRLTVGAEEAGQRLDVFLAGQVASHSRSLLARACGAGGVSVNGRTGAASRRLKEGEIVELELELEDEDQGRLEAEDIALHVLHEDESLLVLDKPAGLSVHPGAGRRSGTLANALLHHLGEGLRGVGAEARPGLVHRLDRGTTGVMVVAKSPAAHAELSRQFAEREVEKVYLALALGVPAQSSGTVDAAIGRSRAERTRMSLRPDGRRALSHWSVREAFGRHASWLEVRIETGRTHQVRVHLASLGHPLAGDPTYGGRRVQAVSEPRVRSLLGRMVRPALHAFRLAFTHPGTGERVLFEAPIPDDLAALLEGLRAVCGPA